MAQDPTLPPSEGDKSRQAAFVVNIVRVAGVLFMIAGTALGFNVFGIAGFLGLADGFTERALGGALFAAGVIDFMLVPHLLEKKLS